jgi:hypothetical protein
MRDDDVGSYDWVSGPFGTEIDYALESECYEHATHEDIVMRTPGGFINTSCPRIVQRLVLVKRFPARIRRRVDLPAVAVHQIQS